MNYENQKIACAEWLGWYVSDGIPNEYTLPLYCNGKVTYVKEPFEWENFNPKENANDWKEIFEKMSGEEKTKFLTILFKNFHLFPLNNTKIHDIWNYFNILVDRTELCWEALCETMGWL